MHTQKPRDRNKSPINRFITLILGIYLILFGWIVEVKLIQTPQPFIDWDESIYMQVGTEMIAHRTIIPQYLNAPWLEKPPLVPLIYGLTTVLPIRPEISARLLSLLFAVIALILVYHWVQKTLQQKKISSDLSSAIALLAMIAVSVHPLFLMRAQTVNADVLLLIGWLGYLIFYPNFLYTTLFLLVAVMSKSLLGFYPLGIMLISELFLSINRKKKNYRKLIFFFLKQLAIGGIWYLFMLIRYQHDFIVVHFQDHLLRRITQSIESHFGKRTYYFDLLYEYWGAASGIILISILFTIKDYFQKRISFKLLRDSTFFIPFFLFLNLTKTKIAWYLYPVIPQMTFLIVYPLHYIRNIRIVLPVVILLSSYLIYSAIIPERFFTTYYSSEHPKYQATITAQNKCESLSYLLDPQTRETLSTLQSMNLLLSTSETYSNNPAMIYYFQKPVTFFHTPAQADNAIARLEKNSCLLIETDDFKDIPNIMLLRPAGAFEQFRLFIKDYGPTDS